MFVSNLSGQNNRRANKTCKLTNTIHINRRLSGPGPGSLAVWCINYRRTYVYMYICIYTYIYICVLAREGNLTVSAWQQRGAKVSSWCPQIIMVILIIFVLIMIIIVILVIVTITTMKQKVSSWCPFPPRSDDSLPRLVEQA